MQCSKDYDCALLSCSCLLSLSRSLYHQLLAMHPDCCAPPQQRCHAQPSLPAEVAQHRSRRRRAGLPCGRCSVGEQADFLAGVTHLDLCTEAQK